MTGVIGNVTTCVVIARNSYMHTATNYYLFSLAISDMLSLVFGKQITYNYIMTTSNFLHVCCWNCNIRAGRQRGLRRCKLFNVARTLSIAQTLTYGQTDTNT